MSVAVKIVIVIHVLPHSGRQSSLWLPHRRGNKTLTKQNGATSALLYCGQTSSYNCMNWKMWNRPNVSRQKAELQSDSQLLYRINTSALLGALPSRAYHWQSPPPLLTTDIRVLYLPYLYLLVQLFLQPFKIEWVSLFSLTVTTDLPIVDLLLQKE